VASEIGNSASIHSLRSSFQFADTFRINIRSFEKGMPKPSKFIADSSLAGNKAGMRRERDAMQHGGILPLRKNPSRGLEWG
jgi:hypothetical protein